MHEFPSEDDPWIVEEICAQKLTVRQHKQSSFCHENVDKQLPINAKRSNRKQYSRASSTVIDDALHYVGQMKQCAKCDTDHLFQMLSTIRSTLLTENSDPTYLSRGTFQVEVLDSLNARIQSQVLCPI
jgi:hypothetical protein